MDSSRPELSIVSPVYGAEKIVPELVKQIAQQVSAMGLTFEIVLVEDGSPDNSWKMIEEECRKHPFVKGVKLSRNFGQHYALSACLAYAKGNYVVVMDCDLQDNPAYISELYAKAKEGYDIVYTYKNERKHSFLKNLTARLYFRVFNRLTSSSNMQADKNVGAFSLLSRKTVDAFNRISDYHRHYILIVRLLGFSSAYVRIEHQKRFEGKSSYNFRKLVRHALNGITSQSVSLLNFSIGIGFVLFVLSMIGVGYLLVNYIVRGALAGYTSLMVMILLSTGLLLMSIGVLGIYIGKIFEQVKNRPLYIVDKKLNFEQEEVEQKTLAGNQWQ